MTGMMDLLTPRSISFLITTLRLTQSKRFSEIDSTQVGIVTWFIKSFLNKVKHIYEVVRSGTPFDIAELLGVQLR